MAFHPPDIVRQIAQIPPRQVLLVSLIPFLDPEPLALGQRQD
jgi:hypothetical protein